MSNKIEKVTAYSIGGLLYTDPGKAIAKAMNNIISQSRPNSWAYNESEELSKWLIENRATVGKFYATLDEYQKSL